MIHELKSDIAFLGTEGEYNFGKSSCFLSTKDGCNFDEMPHPFLDINVECRIKKSQFSF